MVQKNKIGCWVVFRFLKYPPIHQHAGFTFLEVLAVLLIIGFFALIAINRLQENRAHLVTRKDVIKTQLRYAQRRAMNSSLIWGIHHTGNAYNLFQYDRGAGTTTPVLFPGEDAVNINLADESIALTVTHASTDITDISFDEWGRPYIDGTASTLATTPIVISLTSGSLAPEKSTITHATGFIP